MSYRNNHNINEQKTKNSRNNTIKRNHDVVDRFLSILWRREVDLKLTFKQKINLSQRDSNIIFWKKAIAKISIKVL